MMNESGTVSDPRDGQKNVLAGRETMNAKEWYESNFRQMLVDWFLVGMDTSGLYGGYEFIFGLEKEDNPDRKPMRQTAEEQSLFAAATCLMVLITQVVWKLVGLEAAVECCRQKKWPVMRVGMGNQMHPLEMMAKAKLIPEERAPERYRTLYLSKIDELRPIMVSELAVVDDAVNRELDEQIRRIRVYFNPRTYPPVFPHKIVKVQVEPKEAVRQEKQKPAQTIDDEKRKAREAAEREAKEAAERKAKKAAKREAKKAAKRKAKEAAEREAAEREAEERFDRMLEKLSPHERYLRAMRCFEKGGDRDGMEDLEEAEYDGDPDAAFALGCIYTSIRDSELVRWYDWLWEQYEADDETAFEYFLKAAEQGNYDAMMEVGVMLAWGAGCERNICRADEWFKKAHGKAKLPAEGYWLEKAYSDSNGKILSPEMAFQRKFGTCVSERSERIILNGGIFLTFEQGLCEIMAPQTFDTFEIPEEMSVFSEDVLGGWKNLKSVIVPQDWTMIGEKCFWNCTGLRTVRIPESLERIDKNAFGCDNPDPDSGLTAFNIPKGLMEIDPHAFGPGALNFENFTCTEGNGVFMVVDGILYMRDDEEGEVALIRCPQGRTGEVVIPKGVKIVEDGAFAYCNKLTKITFLDEDIYPGPESAYEGCSDKLEKNW